MKGNGMISKKKEFIVPKDFKHKSYTTVNAFDSLPTLEELAEMYPEGPSDEECTEENPCVLINHENAHLIN